MHITLYIYFYLHCSKLLLFIDIDLVNYILQEMVVEKEGETVLAWLFCEWRTGRLHIIVYITYMYTIIANFV